MSQVASAESAELFTEAEGSESFSVGLIGEIVDASALAPADGERETTVTVEASMRVESAGGDVLAAASSTDTAPVTVTRKVETSDYGSVGGDGQVTIKTGKT